MYGKLASFYPLTKTYSDLSPFRNGIHDQALSSMRVYHCISCYTHSVYRLVLSLGFWLESDVCSAEQISRSNMAHD